MSGSPFGDGPGNGWLGPVGSLEVEDDEIGEIGSVFILATKDKQFVPLV